MAASYWNLTIQNRLLGENSPHYLTTQGTSLTSFWDSMWHIWTQNIFLIAGLMRLRIVLCRGKRVILSVRVNTLSISNDSGGFRVWLGALSPSSIGPEVAILFWLLVTFWMHNFAFSFNLSKPASQSLDPPLHIAIFEMYSVIMKNLVDDYLVSQSWVCLDSPICCAWYRPFENSFLLFKESVITRLYDLPVESYF